MLDTSIPRNGVMNACAACGSSREKYAVPKPPGDVRGVERGYRVERATSTLRSTGPLTVVSFTVPTPRT